MGSGSRESPGRGQAWSVTATALAGLPPAGAPAWAHEAVLSVLGAVPLARRPHPRQDLAVLQDKLRISTKKLEEYETLFKCQEETTQKLVLEYQARLEEGEERLRRQQEDKDIQMKGIISRWAPPAPALGPFWSPAHGAADRPPEEGKGQSAAGRPGVEGGECPRQWGWRGTRVASGAAWSAGSRTQHGAR